MKEEDDIAKLLNDNKVEHFDIKPEWIDDMSAQLDAYNAQKGKAWYWWLSLLLIPAIIIPVLLYNGTEEKKSIPVKEISQTESHHIPIEKEAREQSPENRSAKNDLPLDSIEDNTTKNEYRNLGHSATPPKTTGSNITTTNQPTTNFKKVKNTASKKPTKKQLAGSKSKTDLQLKQKSSTPETTVSNANNSTPRQNSENNSNPNDSITETSPPPINSIGSESASEVTAANTPDKSDQTPNQAEAELNQNNTSDIPVVEQKEGDQNQVATNNLESLDSSQSVWPEEVQNALADLVTPTDSLKTAEEEGEPVNTPDAVNDSTSDIKDKDESKKWSVGFTFGPDLLTKRFTASTDFLNFEQKKAEEVFDNTWGYDFEVNYYLKPWLAVGTGLGFKTFQEFNEYSSTTIITFDTTFTFIDNSMIVVTDSIDSIIQDGNGGLDTIWIYTDSVLVIDTMTVVDVDSNTEIDSSKKVANGTTTSSYVQIPINAQFTFIQSKKLTAYANLGLTIGLLTKNTGKVVDFSTNEIVNFTTRKMIYTSTIGLGFNYNIFGPFDYKLYGAYQFQLSNLSVTPNVDKRYNGLAVRTGLVYRF